MSDDVARGLEGVTVAETRLSDVDGEAGELVIAGFPVADLAPHASYEETLFLLWNDRLPDADELAAFREDLAARRAIGPEVRALLERAAAEERDPMHAVRLGVAAATLGADESDDAADARRVVAVLPTVAAAY